jgi:hypothetical protein
MQPSERLVSKSKPPIKVGDVEVPYWTYVLACLRIGDRDMAEGRATAVLKVLEARGIAVSTEQRRRIEACEDKIELSMWLVRAEFARAADDVFV